MPLERDTDEQHAALSAEWAAAETGAVSELSTGRVWGLPELADGDCWVDIAGAAVLLDRPVKTISGWLSRNQPKGHPFPAPHRLLYRVYWRFSEIRAWQAAWQRPPGPAAPAVAEHDVAESAAAARRTEPADAPSAAAPAPEPARARPLRAGEALRVSHAQLDAYTLVGTDSGYRVEIAGVWLGSLQRPAGRRSGWQAHSTDNRPLGKPARTRQDAVVVLLGQLPGLQITED